MRREFRPAIETRTRINEFTACERVLGTAHRSLTQRGYGAVLLSDERMLGISRRAPGLIGYDTTTPLVRLCAHL